MTDGPGRYSRQELLPGWGAAGQEKLRAATVVVVGCGALGSHQAQLLARAGVGHLRIVDRDLPEIHNLQRQVLFDEDDVAGGLPKADIAARKLRRVNAEIAIEGVVADVNPRNVETLLDGADLVLDATDNFETRFLVNDACVKHRRPWVYGGVIGTEGMLLVIRSDEGPCLRCALPDRPAAGTLPTCDTAGILNTAPAFIAALQVTEALRLLVGATDGLRRMLHYDLVGHRQRLFEVARQDQCPTCGLRRFEYLDTANQAWLTRLCGRNAVQLVPAQATELDLAALATRLAPVGRAAHNGCLLNFQTGEYELIIFPDGRAIIKGTQDESVAKGLYARFIGS